MLSLRCRRSPARAARSAVQPCWAGCALRIAMSPGVPLLFGLVFCRDQGIWAQTGSTDNETKSQPDFNSSNPAMDFSEENPDSVSVHLPLEEDRQRDMQADSFTTASSGKPQFSFWSSPKTQEYRSLVSRQEILGYERWNISCHISEQRISQSRAMTATMAAELVSPEGAQEGKNTAI
ncbi:uncharacterized protein LOC102411304 isoform X2 [Bubalus bubalis]|uniref:uncharacterized protein LOC102411304 isoform X2 n=1 Tax=Bubalus bubalis TaxID=89462 RepID=UPI001E1B6956|nr:uncharacterized protein LOC102411304 isoform X2 [Bubalus bubalis]